jgi:hypothetical protein
MRGSPEDWLDEHAPEVPPPNPFPPPPPGKSGGVLREDFHAYMPMHTYIFAPSGQMWPAASVNARIPPVPVLDGDGRPVLDEEGKPKIQAANQWLDKNRAVEQMTWAPGLPALITDRLVADGGWISRKGVTCFNLYRPPTIELGDRAKAKPWLEHGEKLYGEDFAKHICPWLAHRVQRPGEKINHALVLGGPPGIGKDSLLEPVKQAVGPWNFSEVSPRQVLGRFNGFLKSVILRISEARDLGEVDRFQFYDATKSLMAAPPDVLRVDEKNLKEYSIFNLCGVTITTNHKTDGLYLPSDDRRHLVEWSERVKEDFAPGYWSQLWGYYERGGYGDVAAYLAAFDLSNFDPKASPPKTAAFWEIADANRAPEEAELQDVIDRIANPDAVTLARLIKVADKSEIGLWLSDRKNRRAIPHRLETCGYARVRNPDANDGLWVIMGARQVIYAKQTLSPKEQARAVRELISAPEPPPSSIDDF